MKKYLEIRIKELKEADAKACKNRWDMSKPANERGIWREQSNEITARRHELEATLKFLNLGSDNCAIIHTVKDSWSREEAEDDASNYDYLRGFIDGYGGEEPHGIMPDGFNNINEVWDRVYELKGNEEKLYTRKEVEGMLFDISTELCWDDKDEDELILNCQNKIKEIKENL